MKLVNSVPNAETEFIFATISLEIHYPILALYHYTHKNVNDDTLHF